MQLQAAKCDHTGRLRFAAECGARRDSASIGVQLSTACNLIHACNNAQNCAFWLKTEISGGASRQDYSKTLSQRTSIKFLTQLPRNPTHLQQLNWSVTNLFLHYGDCCTGTDLRERALGHPSHRITRKALLTLALMVKKKKSLPRAGSLSTGAPANQFI